MSTAKLQTLDLPAHKHEALQRFLAAGFPTNKLEEWKYASLKSLNDVEFNWLPNAEGVVKGNFDLANACIIAHNNAECTFDANLPEGVSVLTFESFAAQNPAFINDWNNRVRILDQNKLVDLNDALSVAHHVIWIKNGVQVDQTMLHRFQVQAKENTAVHIKYLIYLEEGSSLTWVDDIYAIDGDAQILANYVQEIWVSADAHLTFVKSQDVSASTTLIDQTFIYQADRSTVDMYTFTLNGAYIRNNLHFYVNGEGVQSNLHGLYVPGSDQLIDSHTVVDHRQPNSESNELYKGVLLGTATGVFNGKIFVRPDAQKTNAFQSCKNVLASDKATMNTKPQLEIWADDVKCSHGTTTGQLSDEALFYLRSRGISKQAAQTLLMLAFVQEVIDKVENVALREALSTKIIAKIQQAL